MGTSNLWILDFMLDLLVKHQVELKLSLCLTN
jgi:hypothetical protein